MATKDKAKCRESLPSTSVNVTCNMCNVKIISAQEQIEHEFSLMHHIKLDQRKDGKGAHKCNLCTLHIGQLKRYVVHLNSNKHQNLVNRYREHWLKNPPKLTPVPPSFLLSPNQENQTSEDKDKNSRKTSPKMDISNESEKAEKKKHGQQKNEQNFRHNFRDGKRDQHKVAVPNRNGTRENRNFNQHHNRQQVYYNDWNSQYNNHNNSFNNGNWNASYPNKYAWNNSNWNGGSWDQMNYNNNFQNGDWNSYYFDYNYQQSDGQPDCQARPYPEKKNAEGKIDPPNKTLKKNPRDSGKHEGKEFMEKDVSQNHESPGLRGKVSKSRDRLSEKNFESREGKDQDKINEGSSKVSSTPENSAARKMKCETTKSASENIGKHSKNGDKDKAHIFFLSSDGESDTEKKSSEVRENRTKGKMGLSKSSRKDYNKTLINQLVNHPCTRKQQLELKRWMKDHTRARKRLSLPRFNLPLGENESGLAGNNEAEMKVYVSEAISELPEDVIVSLFEALSNDGCAERDSTVDETYMGETEDLTEEGNLPWAEFLKSLSISDPCLPEEPTKPMVPDQEVPLKESTGTVVIKTEIIDQPNVIDIDPSSDTERQLEEHPAVDPLEEILLPDWIKAECPQPVHRAECPQPVPRAECPQPVHNLVNAQSSINENRRTSNQGEPAKLSDTGGGVEIRPNFTPTPPTFAPTPPKSATPVASLLNPFGEVHEDLNNLLHQLEMHNLPTEASVNPSAAGSPQELVNRLLALSNEEDQLRENTQKVEQMISHLHRLLEEWKTKRAEIMQEELRLRNKRIKLLESLQGHMSKTDNPENKSAELALEETPHNVTYLGTLDRTFNHLNQLGSAINVAEKEVHSDRPKSKKKKEKTVSAKRKKKKAGNGIVSKKRKSLPDDPKKNNDPLSPAMLQQLMDNFTVPASMPSVSTNGDHISKETEKRQIDVDARQPVFVGSDEEEPLEKTFGPINIHSSAIIDLKLSNGYLYTCSSDSSAKCIDIRDSSKIVAFDEHKKTVSAIEVQPSEDGRAYVFTASHDGYLRCFDSETGECINKQNANNPIICMTKGWSKLYIGLYNGLILPYSITNCKFLEPVASSESSISKIVTCTEGSHRLLCVASYDGSVTLRRADNGLLIRCMNGRVRSPCCMHVDLTLVYITTAEKTIRVHDLLTGTLLRTITCPSSATGLFVNKEYVLSSGFDGLIRCYRKKDWTLHCLYYGAGKSMVMCMEVCGNWVYTGNRDGIIEAFEIDYKSVVSCQFQKCSFPFGRMADLRHHLELEHLPTLSQVSRCPWRSCQISCSKLSRQEAREHVVSHCLTLGTSKNS